MPDAQRHTSQSSPPTDWISRRTWEGGEREKGGWGYMISINIVVHISTFIAENTICAKFNSDNDINNCNNKTIITIVFIQKQKE